MDTENAKAPRRARGAPVFLGALVLLAALNVTAVAGLFSVRKAARQSAAEDLRLQTEAHAQALRATLASLRGDFLFLSQSPPLARAMGLLASADPVARRWARLDLEGSVLLFLQAHPPVQAILVRDAGRAPHVAAGRRAGAPVLLRPGDGMPDAVRSGLQRAVWDMRAPDSGSAGSIESWVDPSLLLSATAPGLEAGLTVEGADSVPADPPGGVFVVEAVVEDGSWSPPVRWRLRRTQPESRLMGSVETLAARFRRTVLLNAVVIVLALPLGLLALRQARRVSRLQAEHEHEEQVRRLERQVEQNERLAALGRMAAGIAHEVNNPLEGMSNYLSVLEEDLRANDVDAALTGVKQVRAGLDRAAGITRQALTLASGERVHGPLDLRDVVRRTVHFVRNAPSSGELRWQVSLSEAPVPVRGHAGQLDQVLLNLLLNACEAQPRGGEVEVECRRHGERAVLEVADRGPGIPEAVRKRLFEPFHSSRGSSGLGLAVCHAIVSEHGGVVTAADRNEGGTRFIVELPAEQERKESAS